MPREYKPSAFSYPITDEPLIAAARAKAKSQRKSFSAYVCDLIERDLRLAVSSVETATADAVRESEAVSVALRELRGDARKVSRRNQQAPRQKKKK